MTAQEKLTAVKGNWLTKTYTIVERRFESEGFTQLRFEAGKRRTWEGTLRFFDDGRVEHSRKNSSDLCRILKSLTIEAIENDLI